MPLIAAVSSSLGLTFHSALIHTAELTGFILYLLIYFPILSIPPHRLKLFMCVAFTAIIMTNWGMLLWAIQTHKDVDKRKHPLEQPQEVLADRYISSYHCYHVSN